MVLGDMEGEGKSSLCLSVTEPLLLKQSFFSCNGNGDTTTSDATTRWTVLLLRALKGRCIILYTIQYTSSKTSMVVADTVEVWVVNRQLEADHNICVDVRGLDAMGVGSSGIEQVW